MNKKDFSALQKRIYRIVKINKQVNTKQLMKKTKRARVTLINNIDKLIENGYLEKFKIKEYKRGSPHNYYKVVK